MGYYTLAAEAGFSAAHRLPDVDQCDRLHGHNWRIRLTVQIDETDLNQAGMGIDFRQIEAVAEEAVADFDHSYLNDLEPFRDTAPTAERLAKVIYERAALGLASITPAASLVEVEAWEMSNYRVTYRPV
ncbi:MAG: 6-carboxytetrahydropterin synthase [Gemmatimonadota bacterium]|nr:MAG: 6-carboxytetrahydropterin synthase [Gemmatimonadota bacterium]